MNTFLIISLIILIVILICIIFSRKKETYRKQLIKEIIIEPPVNSKYNYNNIENLFNNQKIIDNIPQGGIIATLFDINFIGCNINNVPDLSDINYIIKNFNSMAMMSKNALDTSYLRNDLPLQVFGPVLPSLDNSYPGSSWQIGILLDVKKLYNYIGCMYTVDSGSIARYQNTQDFAENITDNEITNNYNILLNTKKGLGLSQAGCGLIDKNILNYSKPSEYFIKNQQKIPTVQDIKNGWSLYKQKPFSRNSWNEWINSIKKIQPTIKKIGKDFIKLQYETLTNTIYGGLDGYRENEVDIFIPSDTTKFSQIWKDSIIGIFTNNICLNNITNELNLNSNDKDCCNIELNKKLVKAIVNKINLNRKNENKIGGYYIETINPTQTI